MAFLDFPLLFFLVPKVSEDCTTFTSMETSRVEVDFGLETIWLTYEVERLLFFVDLATNCVWTEPTMPSIGGSITCPNFAKTMLYYLLLFEDNMLNFMLICN